MLQSAYINGKVFTSTTPWKPKNLIFFPKKFEIRILTFDEELKSPELRQYQSYISNWYINGMVFTSTTPWKPINVKIFQKVWNWQNLIMSVPRVSVCREKKSPRLRQYQSYISNWYVNGKVFTNILQHGNQNIWFFFKKVRNWIRLVFWLVLKSWNHSSRSQHAPICRHRGCIVVPLRVDI